ncbi:GNAT family N-acetyltransferase [Micrococcus luteus]|uniref:GNAT family N-acetyltransferase n=1 Tax=Micrococcus luteus TaxID=1270 RepID=UPI003980D98A
MPWILASPASCWNQRVQDQGSSAQPAEIAWVMGAPWQRNGYASAAAALLLAELAEMGVKQVIAHIHPDHGASAAVARRIGMSPTDEVVDGEVRWEGPVTTRG